MDNPIIPWEEWEQSRNNVEDVLAFVNTILEKRFETRDVYFAIVPSEDAIEIVFQDDTNRRKGGEKMELKIKKDGTIYLMGKEIGKAPHTLEKIPAVSLMVAGKEVATKGVSLTFDPTQEIDEIVLTVFIE